MPKAKTKITRKAGEPRNAYIKKMGKSKAARETESADAGTDAAPIVPVNIPREDADLAIADIAIVFNARTEFDDAKIETELVPSIKQWGILTRLWVYPLPAPVNGANYGLMAGECRMRAATMVGLLMVPVTIYHCTGEQAVELGLIDNIQRANLSEIDEAFGYKKLLSLGYSAWNPADPEKSVGHKLGVSKTKVYSLLKLTDLPKFGLAALRAKEISPSVAVRIARIPNPEAQKEALAAAVRDEWTDSDAADIIAREYMTELKGAPFDRKDKTLVKRGSCVECPYRSGNLAELFPEFSSGRADVCTDVSCFRKKCERSFERKAAKHVEGGGIVLTADQAKKAGLTEGSSHVGGEWAEMSAKAWWLPGKAAGMTVRQIIDQSDYHHMECLALANDGSGKHFELIKRDDVETIALKLGLLKKEKGEVATAQAEQAREQKRIKQRDRALVFHQIENIINEIEGTYMYGSFLRPLALWLIEERPKDAIRHILARRAVDFKAFRLEGDNGGEHRRALADLVKQINSNDLFPLVTELLVMPEVLNEGKLQKHVSPIIEFHDVHTLESLYESALDSVPGGAELKQRNAELATLPDRLVEELSKQESREGLDVWELAEEWGLKSNDLWHAIHGDKRFSGMGSPVRLAIWDAEPEAVATI